MPNELDAYTKRPRTPNDPYTLLTDEQIRNIKQVCNELIKHIKYLHALSFYLFSVLITKH